MGISRSENMSRIRGKGTGPEARLARALVDAGLTFTDQAATVAGRPDIVFSEQCVAVFIDGCFWHGCPVHYVRPRSREDFWREKLRENVARDRRQTLMLEEAGWRVVRIWEHEVFETLADVVDRIRRVVAGGTSTSGPDWRVEIVEAVNEEQRLERRTLVDLRDTSLHTQSTGRRVTAKWRRPRDP